jgi:hypothetical protein
MEHSAGAFVLSIDASTADVDVDVDGAFETWGIARVGVWRMRWTDAMGASLCMDARLWMRCDAMRCDTPPDIVEQTTHERKNSNSGSFNNQIR